MISITLHELLKCLSEDTFKTAVEISRQLHIGERTVRTRLKELNDELKEYGAYIESKPRFGSRLVIQDIEKYEKLETENTKEDQLYLDTVKERENFLAVYLLSQGKYIKMDDLCDFLHISKSTLTAAIKQVENVYKKYGIQIQRRPNYGIIAEGTEMNFRRCIGISL